MDNRFAFSRRQQEKVIDAAISRAYIGFIETPNDPADMGKMMKRITAATAAAVMLAGCAGSRMPLDADVWRNGGTGPYGVGVEYPGAPSVSEYFAAGGAPYRGFCGRTVTGVANACTAAEMRGYPQAARWREIELPAAQARSASALAVTIGGK